MVTSPLGTSTIVLPVEGKSTTTTCFAVISKLSSRKLCVRMTLTTGQLPASMGHTFISSSILLQCPIRDSLPRSFLSTPSSKGVSTLFPLVYPFGLGKNTEVWNMIPFSSSLIETSTRPSIPIPTPGSTKIATDGVHRLVDSIFP